MNSRSKGVEGWHVSANYPLVPLSGPPTPTGHRRVAGWNYTWLQVLTHHPAGWPLGSYHAQSLPKLGSFGGGRRRTAGWDWMGQFPAHWPLLALAGQCVGNWHVVGSFFFWGGGAGIASSFFPCHLKRCTTDYHILRVGWRCDVMVTSTPSPCPHQKILATGLIARRVPIMWCSIPLRKIFLINPSNQTQSIRWQLGCVYVYIFLSPGNMGC